MRAGLAYWAAVLCIVGAVGALEVRSALGETQTWDEGIHLVAGFTYLTRGDYSWNQEHPPLAKIMSALPLTGLRLSTRRYGARWEASRPGAVRHRLSLSQPRGCRLHSDRGAQRHDSTVAPVPRRTGLVDAAALRCRRRLAGCDALRLRPEPDCAQPLRHDGLSGNRLLLFCVRAVGGIPGDRPFPRPAGCGGGIRFGDGDKFSAVILIPTLIALYGWRWAQRPREFPWRRPLVASATLLAALALLVSVLYWPETVRCFTTHVPRLDMVADRSNFVGRILFRLGRWFHLPAHRYLWGLGAVASHNSGGHSSYLRASARKPGFGITFRWCSR